LGKSNPRGAYFPFADSATNLEDVIRKRCKDLPNEVHALFRSFKPYKGGDDLLWALNRICNANKHRLLAPAGIGVGGAYYRNLNVIYADSLTVPAPRWDSAKNEIIFLTVGPKANVTYNINVSFDIALNEVDIVAGQPVVAVLNALADKVSVIIERINAKAFKMGLLK
jgi:hypothetical protein